MPRVHLPEEYHFKKKKKKLYPHPRTILYCFFLDRQTDRKEDRERDRETDRQRDRDIDARKKHQLVTSHRHLDQG